MSVPLEQFVKHLEDSGILASETLQDFLPPKASPQNAEDLAHELVRQKKLTKFQADEVFRGNGMSLSLGNYVLLEKIGAGGMGQVFKAEHRRMKRIVAVKMLPAELLKNAAVVARFEREVMAVAKLNHPNIVTAFDAGNANGVHLLIMEHVEGNDLAALVKKQGPLAVSQAVNCILQAARGLQAAHAEGVVHRDIKPANLLLDKEGTVKILDMGLARLSADVDSDKQAGLTNTGTIMGTVDYMAPEQAVNTKTADARADIYSLGCSLFYLLTGKATYQGDTLMKKLLAHREQPLPSIQAICPEVPGPIDAVFRRMIAKRVEDRYQKMADVILDLEACLAGVAVTASPAVTGSPGPTVSNPFPVGGSGTMGNEDAAFQDFLNAILPAAGATGARPRASTLPVSETMAIRFGDHTRTKEPEPRLSVWSRMSTRQRTLIAGSIAALVIVASISGSSSRNKSGIESVRSRSKQPGTAQKGSPVAPQDAPPAYSSLDAAVIRKDQNWTRDVTAMSAEGQVDAVTARLKKLNPKFDGKITRQIEHRESTDPSSNVEIREVTELSFAADQVSDISPVRALTGLRSLTCRGVLGVLSPLKDISALKGLSLTHFDCGLTSVDDLSPLTGMPLIYLDIYATTVSDLSPLAGMALTYLSIQGAPVTDLWPLAGMPLKEFICTHSPVPGLMPLAGMPLEILRCSTGSVADLSPLHGMPLTQLDLTGSSVSDLSPLADTLTLTHLNLTNTQVSNVSPLADLKLTHLYIAGTQVTDLAFLKDVPLKAIVCDFVPKRDAAVLRSMTTLETINGKPAAEFWKAAVEQQKGKMP